MIRVREFYGGPEAPPLQCDALPLQGWTVPSSSSSSVGVVVAGVVLVGGVSSSGSSPTGTGMVTGGTVIVGVVTAAAGGGGAAAGGAGGAATGGVVAWLPVELGLLLFPAVGSEEGEGWGVGSDSFAGSRLAFDEVVMVPLGSVAFPV